MLELVISWDDERDALRPQWRVTAYEDGAAVESWDLWDGHGVAAPDDSDADLIVQALAEAEEQAGRKADAASVDRELVPTLEEFEELQAYWEDAEGSLDDEFGR